MFKMMKFYGCLVIFMLVKGALGAFAPTGCTFTQSSTERATCDFADWQPPLMENDFGPGDVYQIFVENIDGTIPSRVNISLNSAVRKIKTTYPIY